METAARDQLAGMRLLVVDDDSSVRAILYEMLEARGATVVEAATAWRALELLAAREFDVVLTDLGLPDMPGEAVIAEARSVSGGRTPAAVVSGADARALASAIEAGAERAFKKPIDGDGLIRYLADKRKGAIAVGIAHDRPTESNVTVLVIEDDGDMRALLRDVLERAGYRVIGRQDGVHLPALVESEHFDAAIVDKELPGPNGLDLLSFLQKRLPAVPVILVTAFGGQTVEHEAVRRGAYSYVEKPFRVSTILDMLATVSACHRDEEPGSPA
ncbi:MAG: response regulator [Candidatus Rokuibacteriota bacterium]